MSRRNSVTPSWEKDPRMTAHLPFLRETAARAGYPKPPTPKELSSLGWDMASVQT